MLHTIQFSNTSANEFKLTIHSLMKTKYELKFERGIDTHQIYSPGRGICEISTAIGNMGSNLVGIYKYRKHVNSNSNLPPNFNFGDNITR